MRNASRKAKQRGRARSVWMDDTTWESIKVSAALRGGASSYLKTLHLIERAGGVDWNRVSSN